MLASPQASTLLSQPVPRIASRAPAPKNTRRGFRVVPSYLVLGAELQKRAERIGKTALSTANTRRDHSPVREASGSILQEGTGRAPNDPVNCGTPGAPRCGDFDLRERRLTQVDRALARAAGDFLDLPSPDPGLVGLSVGEAVSKTGVEHGAGLFLTPEGKIRIGTVSAGDTGMVRFDLTPRSGEKVLGIVHTHPVGGVGHTFSKFDVRFARELGRRGDPFQFRGSFVIAGGTKPNFFDILVFEPRFNTITPAF